MLTLQQIFGRPEYLVRSLITFSTTVQNLIAFLNNEHTWQHLSNPMLLEELVGKLPLSKRLDWAKKEAALKNPTIQHF